MATRKKTRVTRKRVTEAQDAAMDKRAGIKEGSARDNALDKARGLPPDKKLKRVGRSG